MQNVVCQGDQHDVGADHSRHHDGMRNAQCAHQWLLLEVREAFFHVGVNGQRKSRFRDFRIFAGFERFGCCFGGFVIFARILLVHPRRDVSAAHSIQAVGRDEISRAVDCQNSCNTGGVVKEADKSPGNEHAALHSHEHRGVRTGELAGRNHFLHQCVYCGPVHRRSSAGD